MTATVDYSTIESAPDSNIRAVMDDRNNIADPRGSSASHRPFVYDSDPLQKGYAFGDFPYIVLELPTIEYMKQSVDGRHSFIGWKHRITVRTARDGSGGNRIDTGRTDMQSIADDMHQTFNSRAIRDSLRNYGIIKIKLDKDSSDTLTIDQKYVYEAVYTLSYENRMAITQ